MRTLRCKSVCTYTVVKITTEGVRTLLHLSVRFTFRPPRHNRMKKTAVVVGEMAICFISENVTQQYLFLSTFNEFTTPLEKLENELSDICS